MIRGGTATFLTGALTGIILALAIDELWPSKAESDVEQYRAARDFVRESFVRDVGDEELVDMALHGMLRGLDPYSRYYSAEEAHALLRETRGRYVGIGAVFRRPLSEGLVLYPLPASPAERAGVRVGDRFLLAEGRPLVEYGEEAFTQLLAAPPGGTLEVTVEGRDGARRELVIQPASVVDPTVRHARMIERERGIGYLAITSFSDETRGEFDRAFEFLRRRGMGGLVLDLRGNLGGVLDSAVGVGQRFLEQGTIVSTEGRRDPVVYRADPQAAWYLGTPLVVLVDGETASASEVLAGALQDHRAAVLVGAPTYGKGMVQTIRHFEEWGTRAKVTSSYYYSPTRRNFERTADPGREHGIVPDVLAVLGRDARRELRAFLQNYSPGPEVIPAIEAWEAAVGIELLDPLPRDLQLEAALALLRGERPTPQLAGG